ncbi:MULTISPECIES: nuclease-related domain-containing protein [Bacillus]|uniref:nuclease-related domain-containing protein n=1 Tax=Bacillus TaxID=1386 RepID=UPI000BB90D72|nr:MULTISPECIES: nuclease-related domain-containing protein [Bacillus]
MAYKNRNESTELLILDYLNSRMVLSESDKRHFINLKKGYEGEKIFDSLIETIQSDCIILNDLLLKNKSTMFQIDSTIIFKDLIYLFEVKNYEGDFFYESDILYRFPKSEVTNPLNQLKRTESQLRQVLNNLGYNFQIRPFIIFINPEFTLYKTPLNMPFIFSAQIKRLLEKLNGFSSTIKENHKKLAEALCSMHIEDSPYKTLPAYEYSNLRKGVLCEKCRAFSNIVEGNTCICKECGNKERLGAAIIRSINEFKLLFPDHKITTNVIHEWCKIVDSKERIQRVLKKNFIKKGTHQWMYYE